MSTALMLSYAVRTLAPGRQNLSIQGMRRFALEKFPGLVGGNLNGDYYVAGTTKTAGNPDTPVSRKVRLLDLRTGRIGKEVWSDSSGNYRFNRVSIGPWTVVAHDHTGQFNAVVADNISGLPM